jgi:hypothetical protein
MTIHGDEGCELGVTLCGRRNLMEGCIEVYDREMTCALEGRQDSVDAWCRPELPDGYCIQRSVVHHLSYFAAFPHQVNWGGKRAV